MGDCGSMDVVVASARCEGYWRWYVDSRCSDFGGNGGL